jgi:TDP-4-keto-6-deoxy-D-glucose transaminase
MIPFNKPCHTGFEEAYIHQAIVAGKLSGDGEFTRKCSRLLEAKTGSARVLLTTSCSHALDMAALLLDIAPGDNVILPSFSFVSTANAFALRGAELVFVDVRPDTMNIDESIVEDAVTSRTKAIVPIHYAGVGCDMDVLVDVSRRRGLAVVEDAAHGVNATYNGASLGSIGEIGAFSFHETKNYVCGEGGAILVNRPDLVERAEIIREKGTNRARFFRGEVDKYTWLDLGSSYLLSELNAAYLLAQLERMDPINEARMRIWNAYRERLGRLADRECVELPGIPPGAVHNAHMFYIKVHDLETRTRLIEFLRKRGIGAASHYLPLHSSTAGKRFGRLFGEDRWTTVESERLLRLPLFFGMSDDDVTAVVSGVTGFFT